MKQAIFNVLDYGAAGDGVTLDTAAIQSAFDACNGAGGGVVYFPPGHYTAGTLELRSNITVYLEHEAYLQESMEMADYAKMAEDCFVFTTGSFKVFLHANHVENLTICGDGVIDGRMAMDILDGVPSRGPLPLLIENGTNIRVENVQVRNSPGWAVTFWGCRHVRVKNVSVIGSHADGIDPVCCQDVVLDGVLIENNGDDSICIKNESVGHRYETRPDCGYLTENIIVSNTIVRKCTKNHPAVKIGTGTAGIFRNIQFHDCIFEDMTSAFLIQLMRPTMEETPERYIENVQLSNIIARNCKVFVDISQMDVQEPVIRNITMQNIYVDGMQRFSRIQGMDEAPVENIKLRNIHFGPGKLDNHEVLFKMEHVHNLTVSDWECDEAFDALVSLKNCKNVRADKLRMAGNGSLLALEGEATEGIILETNGYAKAAEALRVADTVSTDAIAPAVKHFTVETFTGDTVLKAGECLSGRLTVRNDGPEGFFKENITMNGVSAGSVRTWLYRDQVKEVSFTTEPVYLPGSYCVQADDKSYSAQVEQTLAEMKYCPTVEIVREGEGFCFMGSLQNVGGTAGEQTIALLQGEQVADEKTCTLAPGERCEFALTVADAKAGACHIPGLLEWDYQLAANTYNRFKAEGNRVAVTAAGKQYSGSGDYEKSKLLDYAAVYKRVEGDFEATVKLISQDASGQYAFAGILVCNDMQHAQNGEGICILSNSPKYGSMGMWRADSDSDGFTERLEYNSIGYGGMAKIVKCGNVFQAFTKKKNEDWVEGRRFEVPAAARIQDVGIFSYANSVKNRPGTAVFEGFEIITRKD